MTSNPNELATQKSKKTTLQIIIAVMAVVLAIVLVKLLEKESPQISLADTSPKIGINRDLAFTATDAKSGIRHIAIELIQKTTQLEIYRNDFARTGYFSHSGPNLVQETITITPKSLKLKDGDAVLKITVRDFSFWGWMAGNVSVHEYPVLIDTRPPQVTILESPRYIKSGGAGLIVYRVNEPVTGQGVTINDHFYPGFRQADRKDEQFVSYIGIPHDTEKIESAIITVTDLAGNKGRADFSMILKRPPLKTDKINVSDGFLNQKLPEFSQSYPEMTGTPVEQYIYVNNEVRQKNAREISRITSSSQPERLWQEPFKQMNNSMARANFADHRTYFFQGKEIDKQVHLGIDLASTRHDEVKAGNHGKVVFADYLGIYGNTVILDHGQGLFSLYAHLSQINVAVDDMVRQDSILGLSGTTGMAGGDHLHFSMLINGIFVNPLEWWDGPWLRVNVENPLTR